MIYKKQVDQNIETKINSNGLRNLVPVDIKIMLNNLTDQLSVESTSLLKDALVGIVDKITLDDKKCLPL